MLGMDETAFAINGQKIFLLGASYYGALGAPEDLIARDFDDLQALGFNWTIGAFGSRRWKPSAPTCATPGSAVLPAGASTMGVPALRSVTLPASAARLTCGLPKDG